MIIEVPFQPVLCDLIEYNCAAFPANELREDFTGKAGEIAFSPPRDGGVSKLGLYSVHDTATHIGFLGESSS